MKTLETFKANNKDYEIRCWHDDFHREWIARAFSEGQAIEGFSYSCSDETFQDLGTDAYEKMMIRCIKDDVEGDRWAELVQACKVL